MKNKKEKNIYFDINKYYNDKMKSRNVLYYRYYYRFYTNINLFISFVVAILFISGKYIIQVKNNQHITYLTNINGQSEQYTNTANATEEEYKLETIKRRQEAIKNTVRNLTQKGKENE